MCSIQRSFLRRPICRPDLSPPMSTAVTESATRTYVNGYKRLEIAWSDSTFELSDVSEELSPA